MVNIGKELTFLVCRIFSDCFAIVVLLLYVLPRQLLTSLLRTIGLLSPSAKKQYRSVLVTGASVGIGAGVAKEYARPGVVLTLTAYTRGSLETTKKECEAKGATVYAEYIDVKDRKAMEKLIQTADERCPLDLVVANAGITARIDGLKDSYSVFETNLLGMLNTVIPAITCMRPRKFGKIIFMSSLGGYAPVTNLFMTPYIATKAAIRTFAGGIRASLREEGIEVSVVCPGFTESRMTQEQAAQGVTFYMLWSLEKAIRFMQAGFDNNDAEIVFPFPLYLASRITGDFPPWYKEIINPLIRSNDPYYKFDKVLQAAPNDEIRELIASGKYKIN